MSNMSYCRFQNTLGDLRDCYNNMNDPIKNNREEEQARQALVELCAEILSECCTGVTLEWEGDKIEVTVYDDEETGE